MKYKKLIIFGTLAILAILTVAFAAHSLNIYSGIWMD